MISFTCEQIRLAAETVERVLGRPLPCVPEVTAGEELRIDWEGQTAKIAAPDMPALCRAFFLLTQAAMDGKTSACITETRHIESCGAFIDTARGAVMTVEACKRYIDRLAVLGLNLFVIYMEVTYTVPEYPYFGHYLGRYTPEELKAIDDYGAALGIEVLPQIQTLAHLGQFLQWKEDEHLKDTMYCLLADEEETYAFIEDEIRSIRACFRTNRLHIGMDEAHWMGLQRYYSKHGAVDRFELLQRHLKRVTDICAKYDFHPMMWSDMFFRLGSRNNEYYDLESHVPQSVIDNLPDVDLVYWDYYHTEPEWYEHMLSEHERMGRNTVFAGGVWTWSGFLPHVEWNDATMYPALRACAAHHIKTVIATMWGDDGNETDYFLALPQVAIFSEFCWRGTECTEAEVRHAGETVSGLPWEAYDGFGHFYRGAEDDRTGKGLIYCDLLYHLLPGNPDLNAAVRRYEEGLQMIACAPDNAQCSYARALFDVAILKARTIPAIREAYAAGDREALRGIAEKDIPQLLKLYEQLYTEHRKQWLASYKRNGWETFALRYGAVTGRIRDVALTLTEYADGLTGSIAELDEPALEPTRRGGMQWYDVYVSPRM
ncbi:MAG: beta-N-acetylhexosaminidase [Clostridia bacterium]|nr:beta-N-acetylhexosaminidase [Clostridia bacterium]